MNLFTKQRQPLAFRYGRACSTLVLSAVLAGTSVGTALAAESSVQNVVSLQSEATLEVQKDVLSITFAAVREGSDAAAVQKDLKLALDAALAEARLAARPGGQVDVRTGNFSMFPRYAQKGGISGWQGNAELVVEGRDMAAISALSSKITTMSIARVMQTLSREEREKVEADVTADAIKRYQAKAAGYAKQFGFGSYQLREVSVNFNETGGQYMAPMQMRSKDMAMAAPPLPVEAGKTTVMATVNGSITLVK